MNFGEIKAFLGEKPQTSPNDGIRQQLREEGLRQASQGVVSRQEGAVSKFSSQTTIGLRIYTNSLNQNIDLADKKPALTTPKQAETSLFDFEEVAKNVLRFVGGVINGAAKSGADKDTLTSLFEQARSGVAQGIKMAEKDLKGFLNDEISQGITRSADLIEQGIQRLQDNLFGSSAASNDDQAQSPISRSVESLSVASQKSGELNIRTRDGDEVTIRFEDFQQFEFNRQTLTERQSPQPSEIETNDVLPRNQPTTDALPTDSDSDNRAQEGQQPSTSPATAQGQPADSERQTQQQQSTTAVSQQAVFVEQKGFSFSVNGELDEAELASIGELVSNANDLAETFFDGDIKTAFNQALELGFDEQELTGFALQLTRQEQVEVVKAYESVSQYDGKNEPENVTSKPVERVSDYLQKMLNVLEQSQQKLENGDQFEKLLNRLINRIQDVDTTEIVSAINDFHAFNKQLLSNLPDNISQPSDS